MASIFENEMLFGICMHHAIICHSFYTNIISNKLCACLEVCKLDSVTISGPGDIDGKNHLFLIVLAGTCWPLLPNLLSNFFFF